MPWPYSQDDHLAGQVDGHCQDADAAAAEPQALQNAAALAVLLLPSLADRVQRALAAGAVRGCCRGQLASVVLLQGLLVEDLGLPLGIGRRQHDVLTDARGGGWGGWGSRIHS